MGQKFGRRQGEACSSSGNMDRLLVVTRCHHSVIVRFIAAARAKVYLVTDALGE